jgi:hypothetical protein
MSDRKWVVCSGSACDYRGAFDTFEEAVSFVATKIVRPRGKMNFEWRCQMSANGTVDYYSWSVPIRKHTEAELEKLAAENPFLDTPRKRQQQITHWRTFSVTEDLDRAAEFVEFPGGPVTSVSISTRERECAYLQRASLCNDNRDRQKAFAELVTA